VVPGETPSGGVVAKITGRLQVEAGAPISLSAVDSTGPAPLLYAWDANGLSFDGADTISVTGNAPIVDRDTTIQVTVTVTGAGGSGDRDSDTVELLVLAGGSSGDEGTWRPEGYPGDAIVTNNYQGQGLHQYKAKWWAGADQEPGDPDVTTTHAEGDAKVWYDMGPV
jgi:chitinase